MLGNKIDVEENKRVVSHAIKVKMPVILILYLDHIEAGNDFLPSQGWDPLLRDQCEGGYQRGASIRRSVPDIHAFPK